MNRKKKLTRYQKIQKTKEGKCRKCNGPLMNKPKQWDCLDCGNVIPKKEA